MKKFLSGLLLATTCLALPVSVTAQEAPTRVVHVYITGGEAAAAQVLRDAYKARGGVWQDVAVASGGAVRTAVSMILAGDPPTAAQFGTSQEHFDLIAKGQLTQIDDVASANDWAKVLPKPILDTISSDGHFYLSPISLHTPNFLWYNTKVLEAAGVQPPTSLGDEFFAAMDKIKAAGYIPFALSGNAIQLHFLFNAFLIDAGGATVWNDIFVKKDEAALSGNALITAFERFKRVRNYSDPGYVGRAWNQTLDLVITDKAAFDILGDWALGTFAAAGRTLGKDFGCVLTGNTMIVHGDMFAFPATGKDDQTAAQKKFAAMLLEPQVQRDFAMAKGSIPLRTDVDITGFNECAKKSYAAFNDPARVVPNDKTYLSPAAVGDVRDLLAEFLDAPEMTAQEAAERYADIVLND